MTGTPKLLKGMRNGIALWKSLAVSFDIQVLTYYTEIPGFFFFVFTPPANGNICH